MNKRVVEMMGQEMKAGWRGTLIQRVVVGGSKEEESITNLRCPWSPSTNM